MGIGRQSAKDLIVAVKAATNRDQMRVQIGEAVNVLQEWLSKRDAQDTTATADFAATKAAQFKAHLDAIPDVVLDPDPVP
jgi:hypothetical protein